MILAYHNCKLETAALIKADGLIRPNAELQRRELNRGRITGLSTEETRFVFLYPDFFQNSKARSTYRRDGYVAFVFDAVRLIKRYNALVGKELIVLDSLVGFIPDARQRHFAQAEIRKDNRCQGEEALKRLQKGVESLKEYGIIEILVPQAIPLTDCIGLVDANTAESLPDAFGNPSTHTQSPTQNRRRKRSRRKK